MEGYENVHVTITQNLRRHLLRRWIQQRDALNAKPENCLRKIKLFLGDSEYFCFFLDSSCWRNIENKIRRTLIHLPCLAHVFRIFFRDREAGIEEKKLGRAARHVSLAARADSSMLPPSPGKASCSPSFPVYWKREKSVLSEQRDHRSTFAFMLLPLNDISLLLLSFC